MILKKIFIICSIPAIMLSSINTNIFSMPYNTTPSINQTSQTNLKALSFMLQTNTSYTPIETIFPDQNLRNYVKSNIIDIISSLTEYMDENINDYLEVSTAQQQLLIKNPIIEQITCINLDRFPKIDMDLSGIEYLSNIETLCLTNFNIINHSLKRLTHLPHLQNLRLAYCNLSNNDIMIINEIVSLTSLDIAGNYIDRYNLNGLQNLKYINISFPDYFNIIYDELSINDIISYINHNINIDISPLSTIPNLHIYIEALSQFTEGTISDNARDRIDYAIANKFEALCSPQFQAQTIFCDMFETSANIVDYDTFINSLDLLGINMDIITNI